MSLKEKIGKGAATMGVAGLLSVSMLAGQAAPAQALLPVVPVVLGAVGGTAAVTAVSGWALAGVAALNLAVIGAALAIKDNGSLLLEGFADFFNPGEEIKAESEPSVTNPPTMPDTDGSYVWQTSTVTVSSWSADKFQFSGAPRPINRLNINLAYSGTGIGANAIRMAYVLETTCKRHSDGTTYNEVRYNMGGILQGQAGYNTLSFALGCVSHSTGELMQARLRAPTTFEKYDPAKFGFVRGQSYDSKYMWAGEEIFWKSADSSFVDPGFRATVECISSSGVKSTLSLDSGFSGDAKVAIPSCAAAGLGEVAGSLSIDYIDGTRTVTPGVKIRPAPDPYTECDPALGNVCKLEIYIDGMPCTVGTVQCAGWVSQHLADPSRVKCFYGTREVSISNCGVLEGSYAYGGSPLTDANTDGNPGTWNDPLKVPGWSPMIGPNGEPVSNPDPTVQPNPDNNPNYQPEPSTDPGTDPAPDPGTGPSTTPMPTTGTNPEFNPNAGENCLGSGWSWNPVSWVMVPVQCALQWAFVPPKVRVDAALQHIQPKLDSRGIQPFVQPVLAGVSGLGGSGCSGPPIDLAAINLPVFYPFSACTAPMSTIASGVNAFFALTLVVQGGMSCIRGVASAFGFNWGLGSRAGES